MDCHDSTSCQITLQYLIPTIGALLGTFMFISPLKSVLELQETKRLNGLNPIPWGFQVANSIGWTFYGLLITNYFVTIPNIVGLFLGLYYIFVCLPFVTTRQTVQSLLFITLGASSLIYICSILSFITFDRNETGRFIMGIACNIVLFFYYSSPISTLTRVIQTKNSASIHIGLSVTSLLNATFWFIYGLFLKDLFIAIPNGCGVVFAIIQSILSCLYPRSIPGSVIRESTQVIMVVKEEEEEEP